MTGVGVRGRGVHGASSGRTPRDPRQSPEPDQSVVDARAHVTAQRREGLGPHAVAQVGRVVVGRVRPERGARRLQAGVDGLARQVKPRAHDRGAALERSSPRNPRQAAQTRRPQGSQHDRLHLVVAVVGEEERAGAELDHRRLEQAIAFRPHPPLGCPLSAEDTVWIGPQRPVGERQLGRQPGAESRVVRRAASRAMVDVQRDQARSPGFTHRDTTSQQVDRIRSAGHADRHKPCPTRCFASQRRAQGGVCVRCIRFAVR